MKKTKTWKQLQERRDKGGQVVVIPGSMPFKEQACWNISGLFSSLTSINAYLLGPSLLDLPVAALCALS